MERVNCWTVIPSFVTNDAALVKNLGLDYKVVYAGSEAALIQAFRTGEQNKTPVLGYFYSPQWFLSEIPLTKISLPKYTAGCDADPKTINVRLPELQPEQDHVAPNSPTRARRRPP